MGKSEMYVGLKNIIDRSPITSMAIVSEAKMSEGEVTKEGKVTNIGAAKEVVSAVLFDAEETRILYWDIARIAGELPLVGKMQVVTEEQKSNAGKGLQSIEELRMAIQNKKDLLEDLDWK